MGKELLHGFIMVTSDDLPQGALGSMFQGSFNSSLLPTFLMETGGQGGNHKPEIWGDFPALNVTLWFLYVLSFLCQSTDHSVAHGKCREGLQACDILWDTTSPGLAVLCLWLMVPVVVGPPMQAVRMGTDLLTISVGQRKATGVHMELRKTSYSPKSEENKKTTGKKSNSDLF